MYPSLVKLNIKIPSNWTARPEQTVTAVMADNSYLTYSFWIYIKSLTTVSESRLFGSVVAHWTFNPAARVQIPPKSWDLKIAVLKVGDIELSAITVQTENSLIRVYTVCHYIIIWIPCWIYCTKQCYFKLNPCRSVP